MPMSRLASKAPHASVEADQAIGRGNALEDRGEFAAALDCYREAVAAAPQHPRAHLNVGNALRQLHLDGEAARAYRDALEIDPGYAHAHFNLATLLAVIGDREGAKAELRDVLRLQPGMVDKVLDAESFLLFSAAFRGDVDPEALAREHFRVGAALARAAGPAFGAWTNPPFPERRLRVGYVSGDFGNHPVALFLRPILARHDRKSFEVYCYSSTGEESAQAREFLTLVDGWREISGVDDQRVAEGIRADGIDVLVDLSGHTERNRLGVFARHPAPIQVTWLGYLNTSGLREMDYRICDLLTDPVGATEHLHTEQLWRMPDSQWCYEPWGEVQSVAQPHPADPAAIVFGSFNQYAKVSDASLDLWCRILAVVSGSRIEVYDVRESGLRETILDRFARRGVDPARVGVHARLAIHDYHAAIADSDIALDTLPHTGATTTLDALWMGVPLVALRGGRGISRSSCSILSSLGMPELVAGSEDDYVKLNVRLARDANWRQALRASLRPRLAASPLMDAPRFVADLEAAYRQMWRRWCSAHP